ncbi:hypothetical protein J1614_008502 [Plenodomus biglobosus]|nr:hypothetical protein J1614_008502 [Plenodomus biglobosus]
MTSLTSSARQNLAACIAMLVLTASSILLRIAVRLSLRQTLLVADWLSFLSFGLFCAYCGVMINYIFNISMFRAFEPNIAFGLDEFKNLLKTAYALEILMGCIITAAKLSILSFYYPIFAVYPRISKVIYATAAACIVWFIIVTFVFIFQCRPVNAYWNMLGQPPACHESSKLVLGYELTNFFLDVIILCIPIKPIKDLQLPTWKKATTLGIFMLGGFVCVASIIRMIAVYDARDPSKQVDFTSAMLWSTIQLGMAILCSCLPALGPLLRSANKPFSYLNILLRSARSREESNTWDITAEGSGKSSRSPDGAAWVRMEDIPQTGGDCGKNYVHGTSA